VILFESSHDEIRMSTESRLCDSSEKPGERSKSLGFGLPHLKANLPSETVAFGVGDLDTIGALGAGDVGSEEECLDGMLVPQGKTPETVARIGKCCTAGSDGCHQHGSGVARVPSSGVLQGSDLEAEEAASP